MFTKVVIFVFIFLVVFSLLFASIPGEFFEAEYEATYHAADQDIVGYYDMANITVYQIQKNFSLAYPGTQQFDLESFPGQKIEYWWDYDDFYGKSFCINHLTDQFLGYWWGWHHLHYEFLPSQAPPYEHLLRYDLVTEWNPEINASVFEAECYPTPHVKVNIFFIPNGTYSDIGDSWDNNQLRIITSYEINWNATGINAMTMLGKLLTFQNPNFGIPGLFGNFVNITIGAMLDVMVAVLILKVVQSVVPLIKGIED